jgi:hypothetical protein
MLIHGRVTRITHTHRLKTSKCYSSAVKDHDKDRVLIRQHRHSVLQMGPWGRSDESLESSFYTQRAHIAYNDATQRIIRESKKCVIPFGSTW